MTNTVLIAELVVLTISTLTSSSASSPDTSPIFWPFERANKTLLLSGRGLSALNNSLSMRIFFCCFIPEPTNFCSVPFFLSLVVVLFSSFGYISLNYFIKTPCPTAILSLISRLLYHLWAQLPQLHGPLVTASSAPYNHTAKPDCCISESVLSSQLLKK